MCGVVGVLRKSAANSTVHSDGSDDLSHERNLAVLRSDHQAAQDVLLSLIALQHRGQDAAGIISFDDAFHETKGLGLVEGVFTQKSLESLTGSIAVGHTRYGTTGNGDVREAQPFTLNFPLGIAIVHNGNIVNHDSMREELSKNMGRICFTSSDTEVLLNWIAHHLSKQTFSQESLRDGAAFSALQTATKEVFDHLIGSYSVVGILARCGLFAFRDVHGIRPLVLGCKRQAGEITEYMVASESIALQVAGFELMRDVAPGELIFIEKDTAQLQSVNLLKEKTSPKPCMFEWVYFASAESELEKTPVYGVRLELGRALAKTLGPKLKEWQVDLVAPVPDTSRTAASALAEELHLPYREVLIKNRYIKRTFILASQTLRSRSVDLKLNPVLSEIRGKNVLLVDDSIVRGTTSKRIVELVRRAGARKVYFLSTCPPIRYPCYYGIDFPDVKELVAAGRSEEDVSDILGADGVVYLDAAALKQSILKASNGEVSSICMACIDERYPTPIGEGVRFAHTRGLQRGKGGKAE